MSGLIGKKLGMTSVFDDAGNNQICAVIELGPNVVTQIRTLETDGYSAVQLGFGTKKAKRTTKALQGHFEKAGLDDYPRRVVEFRDHSGAGEYGLGDAVTGGHGVNSHVQHRLCHNVEGRDARDDA